MSVLDFDLTMSVPVLSVTFLGVTCFLSLTVPLLAVLLFRTKLRSSFQALFYGIADSLALEFMLCNVVWMLLLLIPFLRAHTAVYIVLALILGCLIFEIGRYLLIGLLKKNNIPFSGLFLFATGISGINSILRVMVPSFESFVIAITVNDVGLETLAAEAGENAVTMLQSLMPMLTCSPAVYLINGLDVFVNLLFHISLTILLYAVCQKRIPDYFLPVTIGIRFLYELPGYLYSYGILITNIYLAEGLSVLIAAAAAYLVYRITVTELPDELASLSSKANPVFPDFNANVRKSSIRDNANILSGRKTEED